VNFRTPVDLYGELLVAVLRITSSEQLAISSALKSTTSEVSDSKARPRGLCTGFIAGCLRVK
jgi:hypothetical protein